MNDQGCALAEAAVTFQAGVGLLTRMCALVDGQQRWVGEAAAAARALVGLLARVRGPVIGQGAAPAEAAAAVRAVVGLLTRVDDLVLGQVLALGETFPALVTDIRALARVCPPMTDQQRWVGEAATTVWARIRLFQILGAFVALQGWSIRESAATVGADGAPRRLSGDEPGFAGPSPSLALSGGFLGWDFFLLPGLLSGSGFYRDTGDELM